MDVIFAQSLPLPNSPEAVGWVILSIAGLLAIAVAISALALNIKNFMKKEPKPAEVPQPVRTKEEEEYVREDEFQRFRDEVKESIKEIENKLDFKFSELNKERKSDVGGLYTNLRKTDEKVNGLVTLSDTHTRQLNLLDGKLDRLIERSL